MNIRTVFSGIQTLQELHPIALKAKAGLTFYGRSYISVDGFTGSLPIDALALRVMSLPEVKGLVDKLHSIDRTGVFDETGKINKTASAECKNLKRKFIDDFSKTDPTLAKKAKEIRDKVSSLYFENKQQRREANLFTRILAVLIDCLFYFSRPTYYYNFWIRVGVSFIWGVRYENFNFENPAPETPHKDSNKITLPTKVFLVFIGLSATFLAWFSATFLCIQYERYRTS